MNQTAVSDKNFLLVATLCFVLGVFGAHRFYCGKIMSGFLMVFTIGGLDNSRFYHCLFWCVN